MGKGNLNKTIGLSKWIAVLVAAFLSGCGDEEIASISALSSSGGSDPTPTPTPTPGPKHIFVTAANHNGKFGINAAMAIMAADLFCKVDANNTNGADYKALLVSSARNTSTDWALAASTEYRRLDDDSIIGTTNASATFDFPLSNYMGNGSYAWTGLKGDWTNHSYNCNNWTDGSYGDYGSFGYTSTYNSSAISYGSYYCAYSYKVICVEE